MSRVAILGSALEAMAGIPDGATVLVGGFGSAGQPVQLIEALVPNRPLRNHPVFGGCERLRNKMKAANTPFLARSDDAALLEHPKVLRKGG